MRILHRLLHALISIWGASVIIFAISRISGDPVMMLLPSDAPPEAFEALRSELGLDKPVWQQYLIFLGNALVGDFGNSWRWQMPAMQLILERLPATVELAVAALAFSVALAVPFGVLSAVHRDGWGVRHVGASHAQLLDRLVADFAVCCATAMATCLWA